MKNDSIRCLGFNKRTSLSNKKYILLLTCFLSLFFLHAQSITWSIVNAAGFEDGVDGSVRWTFGEPLTMEIKGVDGAMRVGFLPFSYLEDEITVSSTEVELDLNIMVSPNPAQDELHIQVPHGTNQHIRIMSLEGKQVMSFDITSDARLDIRDLPSGPYILHLVDPSGNNNAIAFIKS